jgi:hypothetical protein
MQAFPKKHNHKVFNVELMKFSTLKDVSQRPKTGFCLFNVNHLNGVQAISAQLGRNSRTFTHFQGHTRPGYFF